MSVIIQDLATVICCVDMNRMPENTQYIHVSELMLISWLMITCHVDFPAIFFCKYDKNVVKIYSFQQ